MTTQKMTIVDAINLALQQEMQKDQTVVVLGEDVGIDGGVFRVTVGLLEKFGEKRVIDSPLAESGIVATSLGMAAGGLKPVAEIQFYGFAMLGLDQFIHNASRIRNRSRGRLSAPMVLRAPYGGGIRAIEHHSDSMEAYLVHTPGIKCVMPSTPYDAKGLMISAIRDPDPVVFLEPMKLYRAFKQEVPIEEYTIPIGVANLVREGKDVTLIGYGNSMKAAMDGAELAQEQGIDVEIIDLRTVSPMDTETIVKSVQKTGRVVVVSEGQKSCGVAAEVVARIMENAFLSLEAPIERVTGPDVIYPLYRLENYYMPNAKRIFNALMRVASY